ncbi:hypothetical protein FIBSPDRAFT_814639 [Athelia psychrophila]|uniref:HD domain-containing protein n=1 Tax=Athelia psychrophila TaxID=1759441 RepID=A0A166TPR6_9AGAM|nr:hypothetical protein FIBSPDRAFT_814639 [Fibularhizoctonia sp. CBS 109695]
MSLRESELFNSSPSWFATLEKYYSQPGRYYHTSSHINALLDFYEHHSHNLDDAEAVQLAIYFHDVYYDPKASEVGHNERKSVEMFQEFATATGVSEKLSDSVIALILATITHSPSLSEDTSHKDLTFFLDIDMSILASEAVDYDAYATNIRKEYQHYDDAAYKSGRTSVLRDFLKSDRIYMSEIFKDSGMEERARSNIKREIDQLTS